MSERTNEGLREKLERSVMGPIRAMRLAYLPLLMVYFAYGALGFTAVAESFWIKKSLSLSPTDLAALGVWLTLPWTVKMVFGELVDSVPIFGSQRKAYILIGASLTSSGTGASRKASRIWKEIRSLSGTQIFCRRRSST